MHPSVRNPQVKAVPKRGFQPGTVGCPFPNFGLGEHEVPSICRCIFDGNKFYVLNSNDMHILNHNGSFGVSSLTFRGLSDDDDSFFLKPYWAKKVEREATETFFKLVDAEELSIASSSASILQRKGLFKSSSNNNSKDRSNIRTSNGGKEEGTSEDEENEMNNVNGKTINASGIAPEQLIMQSLRCNIEEERLILMPEEAIFLSFGVGCLTIQGLGGNQLNYRKIWKRLVELDSEFPIAYAVYHHFRSKNWVPKLGNSYGASYLLYKIGPSAYHASYLVHILGFPSRPNPTWNDLNAWVRLGCHVSKNVLLCEVSVPRRFEPVSSEPKSIFDMTLKEISLFRWKASSGTLIKM